jgi:hypothetical protein
VATDHQVERVRAERERRSVVIGDDRDPERAQPPGRNTMFGGRDSVATVKAGSLGTPARTSPPPGLVLTLRARRDVRELTLP